MAQTPPPGRELAPRPFPRASGWIRLSTSFFSPTTPRGCARPATSSLTKCWSPMSRLASPSAARSPRRGWATPPSSPWSRPVLSTGLCRRARTSTMTCTAPLASPCTASLPANDVALRRDHIIRIYDIVFDQDVLFKTDEFVAEVMKSAEFQKRMKHRGAALETGPLRAGEGEGAAHRLPLPDRRGLGMRGAHLHVEPLATRALGWALRPCGCRATRSALIPSWTSMRLRLSL